MFIELIIYSAGVTRTFDRTMKEAAFAAMKASLSVFFEERNSIRYRDLYGRGLFSEVRSPSNRSTQVGRSHPEPANASFVPRQSIMPGNVSRPTFAELEEYARTKRAVSSHVSNRFSRICVRVNSTSLSGIRPWVRPEICHRAFFFSRLESELFLTLEKRNIIKVSTFVSLKRESTFYVFEKTY